MIKVLVALRVPGVDVHEVIQVHRRYLVELMQQWTRIKEDEAESDLSLALVVDAELFRLDSVIRWLDSADGRLKRAAADPPRLRPGLPAAAPGAARPEQDYGDHDGSAAMTVLELRDVSKTYGEGAGRVRRPPRRQPDRRAGRAGGGDGPERLGQEHAAHHRRAAWKTPPAARC